MMRLGASSTRDHFSSLPNAFTDTSVRLVVVSNTGTLGVKNYIQSMKNKLSHRTKPTYGALKKLPRERPSRRPPVVTALAQEALTL